MMYPTEVKYKTFAEANGGCNSNFRLIKQVQEDQERLSALIRQALDAQLEISCRLSEIERSMNGGRLK